MPYFLIAAAAFAACVLATGAIIGNRYDAAVALVLAVFLLLLAYELWTPAALVLGGGFALKLTPAILLPLVFAAMRDKDVGEMFRALLPETESVVLTRASNPRAAVSSRARPAIVSGKAKAKSFRVRSFSEPIIHSTISLMA